MVTLNQSQKLIEITDCLRKKQMSIADLSRETKIKRTTLNYYLKILETKGLIEKERIQEKEKGRPTILKFKEQKYQETQKKWERDFKEKEKEMLENGLTLKILKLLNENKNPSLNDVKEAVGEMYLTASHLNWLITRGFIVNEFSLTPEGRKILKQLEQKHKSYPKLSFLLSPTFSFRFNCFSSLSN